MAFTIKQGDSLPNLFWQLFLPDKVTPLNLNAADDVFIAIRYSPAGELLLKNPCVFTNKSTGSGYYDWQSGDTDNAGTFEYEFEIHWSDGNVQTVPADGYYSLVIVDDIA